MFLPMCWFFMNFALTLLLARHLVRALIGLKDMAYDSLLRWTGKGP